tara:strand:+ start:1830 stop:3092 length:1263 start_codon:yes stop_codon:yes gene_type:complete
MKNFIITFITLGALVLFSCNPECENFARVDATVEPRFDLADRSLLITTSFPNFLDERELFTERLVNGEVTINESTKVNTTPTEGGYLVKIDDIGEGNFKFYVVDNDCGGFIPLNVTYVCDPLANINAEITPSIRKAGKSEQILISTSPASFLANRDVFIQREINGEIVLDENDPLQSIYSTEAGGRIAILPDNAAGNAEVFIMDEQCGGFIPVSRVRVADQEFINNNLSLFITPTPPNIVIPPINIPAPTNIVNTWFSPDNRAYCIWFLPSLVKQDEGCYEEQSTLYPGMTPPALGTTYTNLDTLDKIGSWELRVPPCPDQDPNNALFEANPVSGVINQENGAVSIAIDRTSKGFPIEYYEGNIVKRDGLPAYAQNGGICAEDSSIKPDAIMVLTSKTTGAQMILYRQNAFGVDESLLCN